MHADKQIEREETRVLISSQTRKAGIGVVYPTIPLWGMLRG